jgi:hypothetical protein
MTWRGASSTDVDLKLLQFTPDYVRKTMNAPDHLSDGIAKVVDAWSASNQVVKIVLRQYMQFVQLNNIRHAAPLSIERIAEPESGSGEFIRVPRLRIAPE